MDYEDEVEGEEEKEKEGEEKAPPRAAFHAGTWRTLVPFLRPFKKAIVWILFFNLLTSLVDIVLPLFQRYAVANFIETGTLTHLPLYTLVYGGAIALQAVSVALFCRQSIGIEMGLGRDLRLQLFHHLQTLPLSYYNVTPVGYLISRVISDVERIATMLAWNVPDMLWAITYVCGAFVSMLLLDARLALILVLILPIEGVLTVFFQSRILHWNRHVRHLNARITGAFNEGITGADTIKTLGLEERSSTRFRLLTGEMRQAGIRAARLNAVYVPMVLFFSTLAVAIVLLRGGNLVLHGSMELATLSAFVSYAVGIFEPVQITASNLAQLISIQACLERVQSVLAKVPEITDSPEVQKRYGDSFHPLRENWEPLYGEIEFRDVTFRYPDGGGNVLEHFSLRIPQGTTVALVGETGAGKSTLVNLVCRFFEPTEGQILIDGRDYRERSQLWLHANIGYVLQNPHLFSGTIRENIRYGRLDATDAEIESAAHAVSADQVISRLEKGWDTPVGEGGNLLSTGEKQLISLARAVLADPRIFVLDEATSSIDTYTEQLINQAVDKLLQGRTSFLIAHRLSTIRKADLILVVRDGQIVERGQHEQLLRAHGAYYALYKKQFAEESTTRIWKGMT